MQLSIYTKHHEARIISHLLAKNPANLYEQQEKGHTVRFVYHTMTDTELYATIFVTPNPLALVEQGRAFDITHYINDRAHAVSSIFLSLIRRALATALNGKPKEPYVPYASKAYPFTFEFGPVASELTDAEMEGLFAPLGYTVTIQSVSAKQHARFITLAAHTTLKQALQQIFVLIPVLDDYKHYYIDEHEKERIERYGEGWLDTHPQKAFILKKALRFSHLLDEVAPTKTRPSLNTLRYEAILQAVKQVPHHTIVDMGCGEGKLAALLSTLDAKIEALDPSIQALRQATKRFEQLDNPPRVRQSSLFYYDEALHDKDVFILCEVIEHIDAQRLAKVVQTLERYAPKTLIITTPNTEYNPVYDITVRHTDHRFEWTRAQFEAWCTQFTHYTPTFHMIGEAHPTYGAPTQMSILRRND